MNAIIIYRDYDWIKSWIIKSWVANKKMMAIKENLFFFIQLKKLKLILIAIIWLNEKTFYNRWSLTEWTKKGKSFFLKYSDLTQLNWFKLTILMSCSSKWLENTNIWSFSIGQRNIKNYAEKIAFILLQAKY